MKKKRIFICLLIVLLGILLWCTYLSYFIKSDKMLIKHLFGVSKTNYEIINVDNTLSNYHYLGGYEVKIRVKEEDMESFINEIERTVSSSPLSEDTKKHESYSALFRNITGKEMKENDVIYKRFNSVQRNIINIFATKPKTVGIYVMYSEPVDGIYEIDLAYLE